MNLNDSFENIFAEGKIIHEDNLKHLKFRF